MEANELSPWNDRPWPFPEGPWPADFLTWWREFFAGEADRRPAVTTYNDLFASPLCPLQRRRELQAMLQLAAELRPRRVMEIGTDKGAGFYHWVKCFPSVEKAVAVEIRGLPYAELFAEHFPQVSFLWIAESSHRTDPGLVANFLGGPLDLLFIDGDKSAMDVDFSRFGSLVRKGGLVFVHDITDKEPGRAWAAIAAKYPHREIIDRSEAYEATERDKQGLPVDSPYEGWLRIWAGRSCGVGVIEI